MLPRPRACHPERGRGGTPAPKCSRLWRWPPRHAYRDELLGLLSRWSEGELPMSAPLKRVEQLIDEGVLQPDVLMVSPDDERYDYHYDHDD